MRWKQYTVHKPAQRVIYCPQNCETDLDHIEFAGSCYGPLLTGCVFHTRKEITKQIVAWWYKLRRQYTDDNGLVSALGLLVNKNQDHFFLRNVMREMGRP